MNLLTQRKVLVPGEKNETSLRLWIRDKGQFLNQKHLIRTVTFVLDTFTALFALFSRNDRFEQGIKCTTCSLMKGTVPGHHEHHFIAPFKN
jgi:hypothetical protein